MAPPPAPDPDPPDTSSESGSNDSFTCSERDSENDNAKIRNDVGPVAAQRRLPASRRAAAAAPPVSGDTDQDTDVSRTLTKSPGSDSNRDSLSAFFTSEDELPKSPASKLLNGGLNLDYLLNWGPNFSKLVGVFQDIAQLPDTQQPGQGLVGGGYRDHTSSPTKNPLSSRGPSPHGPSPHGRTVSPYNMRPPSRTKSPHRTKSPRARNPSPLGRTVSPLGVGVGGGGRALPPNPVARNASPLVPGRTMSPMNGRPPSRQLQMAPPPHPPPRPPSVLKLQTPPSPLPHPGVSPIPHLVADSLPNHVTLDDSEDGARSPLRGGDSVQDSREEYV